MNFFQYGVLSFVQGFSEFLPISSKGHLNLVSYLFGLQPSLTLDIILNTATLLSVLFVFRRQLPQFLKLLPYIVLASFPVAIVGVLFKDQFESIFNHIEYLPYFLMFTSLLLFLTRRLKPGSQPLTYSKALIIGLFQALALFPGVSRSGSTIAIALLLGLSPSLAFDFSFFIFIPASFGALLLDLKKILYQFQNGHTPQIVFSFFLTFIIGLIALSFLRSILKSKNLWYFSIYTFLLAFVVLALT